MIPVPDEFNYIAPAISSKMTKPSKKKEVKNQRMKAKSRYGEDKNTYEKGYFDARQNW